MEKQHCYTRAGRPEPDVQVWRCGGAECYKTRGGDGTPQGVFNGTNKRRSHTHRSCQLRFCSDWQHPYVWAGCHSLRTMPPKGRGGRSSGSGAGRSSAGPGLVGGEVVPAHGQAAPAVATDKYTDANPDVVVAVNEAHMLQVNDAMDIVRDALPGGTGKES